MLRRGHGNDDSLPTYGGGSGGGLGGVSSSNSRGYGGYSGGLSPSASNKYSKRRNSAGYSPLAFAVFCMAVFNLFLTGFWMSSRGHYRSLLQSVNAKDGRDAIDKVQWTEREVATVQAEITREARRTDTRYTPRIKQLEEEIERNKAERDELREKHESEEKKKNKLREPAYLRQIGLMQQAIRKESKRTVLERFGPGPHEVQMTFIHNNVDYDIVIEMAPLDTVPHAIHLFLEQIEHGLWNGAYFYINTRHVLQAGPSSPNGYKDLAKGKPPDTKRFEDLQLDTLAFPDYSHEFPHDIWTVGFAGRPGGPDFYINKLDNIESHGPGGQIQHALEEQGDSCFGRITKGKEHMDDLLFNQPTIREGDFKEFMQNQVPIVRAVILTPKPDSGAPINLVEIPEPMEFQLGRSLKNALEPLAQTLIDTPVIEVKVEEEDADDSSPVPKEDPSGMTQELQVEEANNAESLQ